MSGYNRKTRKVGSSRSGGYDGSPLSGSVRGGSSQPVSGSVRGGSQNVDDLLFALGSRSTGIPYSGFVGGTPSGTPRDPLSQYLGQNFGNHTSNIKFQEVLSQLGKGQTDVTQLLAALLSAGDNGFTDERWDMLYQYLLSVMNTADQRNYDWSMLQDSRLYGNPMNELARYMGSGISRDAAIQMLSGSAGNLGGSTIGSGALTTPAPTGISGTQELAKQQTTSGIVFGAVDALNSLLSTGMEMSQGVEQVKNMQAQNYWNQQQISAFDSVQQVTQALQTMQTNGMLEPSEIEGLSNANDLIKFLQDKSKDNEQLQQLVKSPAYQKSLGTSYGRDFFNKYWSSLRDSRNAGDILDEFLIGQRLDNATKRLQPELISAEISKIGQENKESELRIVEIANKIAVGNAQIEYMDKQGRWVTAQTSKTYTEQELIESQITGQNLQNELLNLNYEYNSAGFPMLKQNRIDELTLQAQKWNTIMHDPKYSKGYLEQMQKAWLSEASNAADAAYVLSLYYNAVADFATTHPGLYSLGQCFKESGMPQLLKIGGTVASPAAFGGLLH